MNGRYERVRGSHGQHQNARVSSQGTPIYRRHCLVNIQEEKPDQHASKLLPIGCHIRHSLPSCVSEDAALAVMNGLTIRSVFFGRRQGRRQSPSKEAGDGCAAGDAPGSTIDALDIRHRADYLRHRPFEKTIAGNCCRGPLALSGQVPPGHGRDRRLMTATVSSLISRRPTVGKPARRTQRAGAGYVAILALPSRSTACTPRNTLSFDSPLMVYCVTFPTKTDFSHCAAVVSRQTMR